MAGCTSLSQPFDETLRAARRALVLGAGGGGDVVGALALARLCESLGTEFVLGGVAWERIVIDPKPGPRPVSEIAGGRRLDDHAVLADSQTATPEGVRFSEALMAEHLGEPTVLIDVSGGAPGAATGIEAACEELGCDLVICADVGGDILATGDEPGLASPLCDAVMLAASAAARQPALLAVIGPGCDGELTPTEVLLRVAVAARAGAWAGTWSLTPAIADEVEKAARASYTEASLQIVRCARGEVGEAPIRGGRRTVPLGPVGALTFFLEIGESLADLAPLAPLVAGSESIEAGRARLVAAGIHSELDYERKRAER
jgi:hypothetical protein